MDFSTEPVENDAVDFLDANDQLCSNLVNRAMPSFSATADSKFPFVTLTWAQSLDGRIAAHPGEPRLIISGKESMQMTFRSAELLRRTTMDWTQRGILQQTSRQA